MKRTLKVIVSVILAMLFVCSSLVAVSADTLAGYKEYKGSVVLISNFEEGKVSNIGVADPLGKSMTAEEFGETDPYCGDVGTLDISISTEHYLQGGASLKMHVAKTESLEGYQKDETEFDKTTLQIRKITNATVPANVSNVYLCFYLYIEKKAHFDRLDLGMSCIELANKIDNIEYGFDFNKIVNQVKNDGWNKIELPFSQAGHHGVDGKMDINRIRIYLFSAGEEDVDLYFDNMAIETIGKATVENTQPKPTPSVPTPSGNNNTTVSDGSTGNASSSNVSSVTQIPSVPEVSGSLNLKEESKVSSAENVESTANVSSEQKAQEDNGILLWIIIGVAALVLAGGAVAAVLIIKNKKSNPVK